MVTSHFLTLTDSRSLGLSWRNLSIHVMTLAVVSWAANNTPMMLSAIWSQLNIFPDSSFEFSRFPSRSLSATFFSLLSAMISLRILLNFFRACIIVRSQIFQCWLKKIFFFFLTFIRCSVIILHLQVRPSGTAFLECYMGMSCNLCLRCCNSV